VGPVYSGSSRDPVDLKNSYLNSLKLASENGIKSISFPSISTGAFGYPTEPASRIALQTVIEYLKSHPEIELVRFVLFSQEDYSIYKKALDEILNE